MAEHTTITNPLKSVDSSTWAVPGALFGVYVLTRLPLGMLAGLGLGFAAGWTLRSEYGDQPGSRARHRLTKEESAVIEEDEKVDAMSDESFPASDPPSYTPTHMGHPRKS